MYPFSEREAAADDDENRMATNRIITVAIITVLILLIFAVLYSKFH